ncbi:MAG: NADH-quinone oxidoreductase subunit M [Gammaproteobacteria bacterium]|nr:MAG: NADH-quinone oxidoreductase subunit M [Gammaproteobacteria bacterium]
MDSSYPFLALLQLIPLAAIAVMILLRETRFGFVVALLLAILELLVAVDMYHALDITLHGLQFVERIEVLSPLVYHAGADGLTVLFMLLTALLTLMVVLYSRVRRVADLAKFLTVIFAIEASLQSLFATQDLLWFTLLSAVELIMVGYVLRGWANAPQEDMAMQRYLQFMGTGLVLLFAGVFLLGWNYAEANAGVWSFELDRLRVERLPESIEVVVFFLLFYGLAIRIPLFPLHGWLPLIAEHGTVAVAGVFLLGLKTGVYGLLRFVFPLVPNAVQEWNEWVVAFAVAGIFYAALLALMQTNLRRLLAFAVVSHTSVLVIGLFTLSELGFQGGIMLSVNFGLATAALLFMTGFVFRRTRTLSLPRLGGLFDHIPVIGIAFLVAGLSIIGMPGTPGFDAAHLMMEASIERFGALVTIAAALGNVAAAAFLLWAFQRAFLAPAQGRLKGKQIEPATAMERVLAVSVIVILLGAGFYSEPWLELIESSLDGLNAIYSQHGS